TLWSRIGEAGGEGQAAVGGGRRRPPGDGGCPASAGALSFLVRASLLEPSCAPFAATQARRGPSRYVADRADRRRQDAGRLLAELGRSCRAFSCPRSAL